LRRANDFTLLGERPEQLDADFQPNAAVPIHRDVSSGRSSLRAHRVPDEPAALRHDALQLARFCAAPDDGEGYAGDSFEPYSGDRHDQTLALNLES